MGIGNGGYNRKVGVAQKLKANLGNKTLVCLCSSGLVWNGHKFRIRHNPTKSDPIHNVVRLCRTKSVYQTIRAVDKVQME